MPRRVRPHHRKRNPEGADGATGVRPITLLADAKNLNGRSRKAERFFQVAKFGLIFIRKSRGFIGNVHKLDGC